MSAGSQMHQIWSGDMPGCHVGRRGVDAMQQRRNAMQIWGGRRGGGQPPPMVQRCRHCWTFSPNGSSPDGQRPGYERRPRVAHLAHLAHLALFCLVPSDWESGVVGVDRGVDSIMQRQIIEN